MSMLVALLQPICSINVSGLPFQNKLLFIVPTINGPRLDWSNEGAMGRGPSVGRGMPPAGLPQSACSLPLALLQPTCCLIMHENA